MKVVNSNIITTEFNVQKGEGVSYEIALGLSH